MKSYDRGVSRSYEEARHEGRIGVIDIGSNSIRLVVYDGIKRTPLPLFNEKILCGLAKGLAITGKLNPDGVKLAEECIKRFLTLVRIMDVVELQILATAAIRDAQDGPAFVENLERKYRISITVVSGKKEASLAAYGVFSSIYKPEGLVGDLGGGSIELIAVEDGNINNQTTIPIGPLRLLDTSKGDKDKMAKIIAEHFDGERWLERAHPQNFYAVGGSFRALAHIHMAEEKYPIDIVHNYSVKTTLMRKFLKEVINASPNELLKMPGVPAKRAESLLPAALVMDRILNITEPVSVVFSSSGIREGYLYEKLSPYLRSEDPLIASCIDLAAQGGNSTAAARELFAWMLPLFKQESDASRRLRFAACILSEIAWSIHPDYRAEWAFYRVIESTIIGLTHGERVALALALYHRYQGKLKIKTGALDLARGQDMGWAKIVGAAANLAFQLSGGMAGNLEHVSLFLENDNPAIRFDAQVADLLSDSVQKRIDALGDSYHDYVKGMR